MRHPDPMLRHVGCKGDESYLRVKPTKSAKTVLRWKGMAGLRDCLAQGIF